MGIGRGALRRTLEALATGSPRRSRALARLHRRRADPTERAWLLVSEANGLLWEGELDRALAFTRTRVVPQADPAAVGFGPLVLEIECLLFDDRVEEARALFMAHREALLAAYDIRADVATIQGLLSLHDGDLARAAQAFLHAVTVARELDPIARMARYGLAAVAHRQQRDDDALRWLDDAARDGGDLFIVRWVKTMRAELGAKSAPRPPRQPSLARVGLESLFMQTKASRARRFAVDTVVGLFLFDALLVLALRAVDYQRGAVFFSRASVSLVAPLAFATLAVFVGARRTEVMRVLGSFFTALPPLLALHFIGARTVMQAGGVGAVLRAVAALWALAVLTRLLSSVGFANVRRVVGGAIVFVAFGLLPAEIVARDRLFYAPMRSGEWAAYRDSEKEREAKIFAQADRVRMAEDALARERSDVVDLYFVGVAAYGHQDVFYREVKSARALMDDRFDTEGRSLVLANDPTAHDVPVAAPLTLAHALRAVGAKMNVEEDVLFLFVTSHGSTEGLSFDYGSRATFEDDVLTPRDLRQMLDESRIRWRVLVISGCESGVFVDALKDERTLLATAAASDRNSYGCAMGNPYTDYGRALFGEQLPRETSFVTAFSKAVDAIGERERKEGLRESRPQLFVGSQIAEKLRHLESRVGVRVSSP